MRAQRSVALIALLASAVLGTTALAQEQIQRPYASPRVTGMGGVMMATGMWDDNFYGNPALGAANPRLKIRLLELPMIETTIPTILAIPGVLGSLSNPVAAIAAQAGSPLHLRIQTAFPTFFIPARGERKWGLGFGVTTSTQIDAIARQSYQASTSVHSDAAFHFNLARQLLPNDILLVGINTRLSYRLSAVPNYSLLSYFQGQSLNLLGSIGDGMMVDGDVGLLFRLPVKLPGEIELSLGTALNNVMGGGYAQLPISLLNTRVLPAAQPRAWGIGVAARRTLWGPFKDSQVAIDVQDIGNTGGGSFFRLLHVGAESRWRFVVARVGIHQGYLTAGLGLYFRYFTLDATTYGEEMGLNAGALESRRFALRAGLQIVN